MSAKQGFPFRADSTSNRRQPVTAESVQNTDPQPIFRLRAWSTKCTVWAALEVLLWAMKTHGDAHAADTPLLSCSYLLMV